MNEMRKFLLVDIEGAYYEKFTAPTAQTVVEQYANEAYMELDLDPIVVITVWVIDCSDHDEREIARLLECEDVTEELLSKFDPQKFAAEFIPAYVSVTSA